MLALLPDDVLGVLLPHTPLRCLFVLRGACKRLALAVQSYAERVAASVPCLVGDGVSALQRYSVAVSVPPVVAGGGVSAAWGAGAVTLFDSLITFSISSGCENGSTYGPINFFHLQNF